MAIEKFHPPVIIENGKELDTSQIDDYDPFMSYLIASAQLSRLNKIAKLMEDEMSVGWMQNLDVPVTSIIRELRPSTPAQSMFLVNDGPSNVMVTVNLSYTTPRVLLPTESMSIDFKGHKLIRFFVECSAGLTSNIRALLKG